MSGDTPMPNRSKVAVERTVMYGHDDSFAFQIGRSRHRDTGKGQVVILSKWPAYAMEPSAARAFAAKIIRAAEKIERGEIPMAPGKDGG